MNTSRVSDQIRLFHGDCREVIPPDTRADLVVTDPAYALTSGGRSSAGMRGKFSADRYDNDGEISGQVTMPWDELAAFLWDHTAKRAEIYVMCNARNLADAQGALERAGFLFHNVLLWNKSSPIANRWYMPDSEFTLFMYRGRARTIRDPGSVQTVRMPRPPGGRDRHPTEKPVPLMAHYIENSSQPGDLVLDPMMGSGTTAVAAARLGRRFVGAEIDQRWFDTIEPRIARERQVLPPLPLAPFHQQTLV